MGEAPVEAAARQAAEILLQDEGIASDLEDPQAEALLRWALDVAKRVVAGRQQCGQSLEREAIAAAIQPVRQAARAINDLVATHEGMAPDELLQRLLALADVASRLGTSTPGEPGTSILASDEPEASTPSPSEPYASVLVSAEPEAPAPALSEPDASMPASDEPEASASAPNGAPS